MAERAIIQGRGESSFVERRKGEREREREREREKIRLHLFLDTGILSDTGTLE